MHMHSILSWVTIPVSTRGSSTLARSWSLEHPSCQASVMFKLPVAQTNQRPLRNYFIYGDGQMVHPITCQVFFRKCRPFSQQFPRTIYQMVIWNKPTGTSGYHSCYVKLKLKKYNDAICWRGWVSHGSFNARLCPIYFVLRSVWRVYLWPAVFFYFFGAFKGTDLLLTHPVGVRDDVVAGFVGRRQALHESEDFCSVAPCSGTTWQLFSSTYCGTCSHE